MAFTDKLQQDYPISNGDNKNEVALNFPLHIFPKDVQDILCEWEEYHKFTPEISAAGMLAAVAGAIGSAAYVRGNNWFTLSVGLYIIVCARSGAGKSSPISKALRPLRDKDLIYAQQYDIEEEIYNNAIAANKNKSVENQPKPPEFKQCVLSDSTFEALTDAHKKRAGGCLIHRDEIKGFFDGLDSYQSKGNREHILTMHSGGELNVNRKGTGATTIPYPCLNIIGSTQPAILKEIYSNGNIENGMLPRFLIFYPDKITPPYWSKKINLQHDTGEAWRKIVYKIYEHYEVTESIKTHVPKYIGFTDEAWEILAEWQNKNIDIIFDKNTTDNEGSVYAKLDGNILKVALILQVLYWATNEDRHNTVIGARAASSAVDLMGYATKSGMKAYNKVVYKNPVDELGENLRDFYNKLPDHEFKTSEAKAIFRDLFGTPVNKNVDMSVSRILNNKELFRKVVHGKYVKI